jgi:hypothetical protein
VHPLSLGAFGRVAAGAGEAVNVNQPAMRGLLPNHEPEIEIAAERFPARKRMKQHFPEFRWFEEAILVWVTRSFTGCETRNQLLPSLHTIFQRHKRRFEPLICRDVHGRCRG